MSDDAAALRRALGQFTTGVAMVTTRTGNGDAFAMVINSFSSVSLDPPLVLWGCSHTSPRLPVFETAETFAINVLAEPQQALCSACIQHPIDCFDQLEWAPGAASKAPLLPGSLATVECLNLRRADVGDHRMFVGEVLSYDAHGGKPLVFQNGKFRSLAL